MKSNKTKNDSAVALINQTQKEIAYPRADKPVFPLQAMHRKELRKLRDKNVGNLQTQIRFIKSQKRDEFIEAFMVTNKATIKKLQTKAKRYDTILNKRIAKLIQCGEGLSKDIQALKDSEVFNISRSYSLNDFFDAICSHNRKLKENKNIRESNNTLYVNSYLSEDNVKDIARKRFEELFSEPFENCNKMVSKINELYEEAINFGDLEQCKNIYYDMKKGDAFIDSIKNLQFTDEHLTWVITDEKEQ